MTVARDRTPEVPQPETRLNLPFAVCLNKISDRGGLAFLKHGEIRRMGAIPPGLMNHILAVFPEPAMVTARLQDVVPAWKPSFSPANFLGCKTATPNPGLAKAASDLINELDKHGLHKLYKEINGTLNRIYIHTEGDEAAGIRIKKDAGGLTFFPGFTFYCGLLGWIVWVYDGHYHVILKGDDAKALLNGEFQQKIHILTNAAAALIHELLHCLLNASGILPGLSEEQEEDIVTDLELLISQRLREDKYRKEGNTKLADDAKDEGNKLIDSLRQRGAGALLDMLDLTKQ